MFSTLLMGGGGHAREKDHQNVKSLIIFARDCRPRPSIFIFIFIFLYSALFHMKRLGLGDLWAGRRKDNCDNYQMLAGIDQTCQRYLPKPGK
jgi:hypothetical protein